MENFHILSLMILILRSFSTSYLCICLISLLWSCGDSESDIKEFQLESIFIGNRQISLSSQILEDIPIDLPFEIIFSQALDPGSASSGVILLKSGTPVKIGIQLTNNNRNIKVSPEELLAYNSNYTLNISNAVRSNEGQLFPGLQLAFKTVNGTIQAISLTIDGRQSNPFGQLTDIGLEPLFGVRFSDPLDTNSFKGLISLDGSTGITPEFLFSQDLESAQIQYPIKLDDWTEYTFEIASGSIGINGEDFNGITQRFFTTLDTTPKFPVISNEELLTLIQEQSFKYFWDFGHPVSGLTRERNTSGETITLGGSGFGLMAMVAAVERGFVSLEEAIGRWKKIVQFLQNADRFHGVFPHWMNGTTGDVIPFSTKDNGGDLVETAFFMQGMIIVRQYLWQKAPEETDLIDAINKLWEEVEWDWFTRGESEALYWHWSPEYDWDINLKIRGHNETQIIYVLAAASPTHGIEREVYEKGYARTGQFLNGGSFYGEILPAGPDYGGPLFFAHYSYIGLDPRNLDDGLVNYWDQNVRHSRINYAYCVDNPKNFVGYSPLCWGLTASDGNEGYSAHSPNNDRGVITPTAAISSIVYTPQESMAAIKHFYYVLGDRLWGEYGFYDAFNPTDSWVANSYLAIDQGPIICMIENYRTGLLWELFMSAPEVRAGLDKLGFTY